MKEMFFGIIVKKNNLYATGYIVLNGSQFKGFAALDYIDGSYENNILQFNMYEALIYREIFENPAYAFFTASAEIELEIPGEFFLLANGDETIILTIKNKIIDPIKQSDIKKHIEFAYKILQAGGHK